MYSVVDHKPKRTTRLQRLVNVERDPRVTLLVDHYSDDWERLWWCRVRGEASVRERPTARPLELLRTKYPQYRDRPPDGPLLVIRLSSWTGWTALA